MVKIMFTKDNNIIVKDIMLSTDNFPVVQEKLILKETLEKMNQFKLGIACIVNTNNVLTGVFTDGDFRRLLLKDQKPLGQIFMEDSINVSRKKFISIDPSEKLTRALDLMESKKIWDLPVTDINCKIIGLVHLHPVVKALL